MTSLTCLFDAESVHETPLDRDEQRRLWCADEQELSCLGASGSTGEYEPSRY